MIKVVALNHVCLVVSDRKASEELFMGLLGLKRHSNVDSWYWIDNNSTLHLVEIGAEASEVSVPKEIQHLALQVSSVEQAASDLLEAGYRVFQMNFQGETKKVVSNDDDLNFGLGTIFFTDRDGNLIELIEFGRGVFQDNLTVRR